MTRNASCRAITHYPLRVPFSDRVADDLVELSPRRTVAHLGTTWAGLPRGPAGLPLTRLLYHRDEDLSGLCRIPNFSYEGNARSLHAILGFQADVEAEAID